MQKRSLLVQVLLDMATGGGAKLEALIVDRAGTFDAGMNKGYNPVTVPSGSVNVVGEKGTVENHSVIVTPKAQVSQGWVNGGTLEGSDVSVSASELVSGTLNVSQAGTNDVTNYKDVSVNAGGTTSYLERTTIDEHSVRLTPKADVASGWQDSKTVVGESVDVDASGLVSGTYPVTASGEFDVTTYEKISVPSGVVSARAIKGVVANHSVLITPSATRTAGFISSGETTGQDVRVDASELVSGTLNVSSAGETDVTNYEKVSVNSGSATPSASKGTASNHVIQVTPIVTKNAGIITSGNQSGTPVSVSAGELVSGTLNVISDGVQDVTNYKDISVPSGSHSASAVKGTVSNHSVTVTPRSTATSGFVQAGTVDGHGVSVSASELTSGTLNITEGGTYDVSNYKYVQVEGGMTKTQFYHNTISGSIPLKPYYPFSLYLPFTPLSQLTLDELSEYEAILIKMSPISVPNDASIGLLGHTYSTEIDENELSHWNAPYVRFYRSLAPVNKLVQLYDVITSGYSVSSNCVLSPNTIFGFIGMGSEGRTSTFSCDVSIFGIKY